MLLPLSLLKDTGCSQAWRHSIIPSWDGPAATPEIAYFIPHLYTAKCESQGVWGNLVIERPQFIPPQLHVLFSSVLRHVCQLTDPLTQVFVSHNKG